MPGREPWTPPRWLAVAGPLLLALFQWVGTIGASRGQPEQRDLDPLAFTLLVAGPLALLLLGRRPRSVTWFVGLATLSYLLADYPMGPVVLSLVVVLVVSVVRGDRLTGWLVAGTVFTAHFAVRGVLGERVDWRAALAVAAWLLLVLAVGEVIRSRRERALTSRQASIEAERRRAGEERLRIAQEVHDIVAHHMSLINVQAGVALHLADRKPDQVEPALLAIKDASKEALVELRGLVGVLRDDQARAPRSPTATLAALDDLVDRSRHAGLSVRTVVTGSRRQLPAPVDLAAFRVVQEAITNVVRHAGAHRAEVRLDYGAGRLAVRIDDDGSAGGPAHSLVEGNGLRGMRERAAALGGTVVLARSPLGGLSVRAELPTEETS